MYLLVHEPDSAAPRARPARARSLEFMLVTGSQVLDRLLRPRQEVGCKVGEPGLELEQVLVWDTGS